MRIRDDSGESLVFYLFLLDILDFLLICGFLKKVIDNFFEKNLRK